MKPAEGGDARVRLGSALATIDRRQRAAGFLGDLGPATAWIGGALLLSRLARGRVDREAIVVVLAAVIAAALWSLLPSLRRRANLAAAARTVDQRLGLADLTLSAWSLGEGRGADAAFLAHLERRAATATSDLDRKKIAPLRPPRSLGVGVLLGALWLASLAVDIAAPESSRVLSAERRSTDDASESLADLARTGAEPTIVEPTESRTARIIEAILPRGLLEKLLQLGRTAASDASPLSAEERVAAVLDEQLLADLEAAVEQELKERSEGPRDEPVADPVAPGDDDILRELRREQEDGSATQRSDQEGEGGERRPGQEGDPEADDRTEGAAKAVQAPSAQRPKSSRDGSAGVEVAVASASGDEAAEAGSDQEGGQETPNPSGSSTGPQAGPSDPFGEATELAVTLELAILQERTPEPPPKPPERERRAAPQKEAEVALRGVRGSAATEAERSLAPTTTPWRYRELSRRFFAPSETDREGTGRESTGRDGTGRESTDRDGTEAAPTGATPP